MSVEAKCCSVLCRLFGPDLTNVSVHQCCACGMQCRRVQQFAFVWCLFGCACFMYSDRNVLSLYVYAFGVNIAHSSWPADVITQSRVFPQLNYITRCKIIHHLSTYSECMRWMKWIWSCVWVDWLFCLFFCVFDQVLGQRSVATPVSLFLGWPILFSFSSNSWQLSLWVTAHRIMGFTPCICYCFRYFDSFLMSYTCSWVLAFCDWWNLTPQKVKFYLLCYVS